MSNDLIKRLKQLRAELAFGADGEGAALVGEAIEAIDLTVQKCADAIVMCPECECTTKSRKAILALSSKLEGASCGDAQGSPVGPKAGSRPAAPSSALSSQQGKSP